MARHLVRLKLSLLGSSFRRGWQQSLGLIAGLLLGVPVALLIAVGLAVSAGTEVGGPVLVLVASLFTLGWTLGPILVFGLDETLDPARLRQLPIPPRQLISGLLVAGVVGVGGLCTTIVLIGAIPGRGPLGIGTLIATVGAVLQLAVCLLGGRALTTALSARLRSRRGRDLVAALGVLAGLGGAAIGQVPRLVLQSDVAELGPLVTQAAGALMWFPGSWPAQGIAAVGDGEVLIAIGWLVASAALALALAWWWSSSLETALTDPGSHDVATTDDTDLIPAAVRFLPANRWGAATAKELRYAVRVPQLRASWFTFLVLNIALIGGAVLWDAMDDPRIVFAPVGIALLQGLVGLNGFGSDRAAVWMLVATGGVNRSDLAGKNAATLLLATPVLVVTVVVLAATTGGWEYAVVAVLGSVAALVLATGIGNLSSVLAPMPTPENTTNAFGGSSGAGCATMILQFVAFGAIGLATLPALVAVITALVLNPSMVPVAVAGALAWSAGVYALCLWAAARAARSLGPKLIDALTP